MGTRLLSNPEINSPFSIIKLIVFLFGTITFLESERSQLCEKIDLPEGKKTIQADLLLINYSNKRCSTWKR